jgi:succinate dehydrogenase membrane anchor subunit
VRSRVQAPVGAHYGLGGWIAQRVSAVVMAVYTLFALALLCWKAPGSYAEWRALFAGGFVRLFTMLALAALVYHAWIGMRDILMDYAKPAGVRFALEAAVAVTLVFYLLWAAAIVWGLA